uniref:Uncharacterized protein n=1 Tax=Rhizophora mucronata TaxID=61149 RepID=A0A2P2R325_RHIMU
MIQNCTKNKIQP